MDLEIISIVAFFVLVGILIIWDRKNIQFSYGVIIRRWKKGKEIIDRFVKKHKNFLRNVGDAAIVIGILASFFVVYLLISFTVSLQQAFAPVLPTAAGYDFPRPIVSVPFWYWLIGIFVVIASHETMHAIFSRLEKIPIKNYGVLLLLLFPVGAFVDIDMKKIKRLEITKKLRIFAAGSFGNILFGVFFFLLALNFFSYFFVPAGVGFVRTEKDFPAYEANLSGVIVEVNDQKIENLDQFSTILNQTNPGETINITTTVGNYSIKTVSRPDNRSGAYIGISGVHTFLKVREGYEDKKAAVVWFSGLWFWLFILSIGIGVANMLPIKPLDGGLIWEEVFKKFLGKKGEIIAKFIGILILALLLFNIFGISLIGYLT